jgi:hypothetical protein
VRGRSAWSCWFVAIAACGRIGFDATGDSTGDARADSSTPDIAPLGPFGTFGTPVMLSLLSSGGDVAPTIASADTELIWSSLRAGPDHSLWFATRPSPLGGWSAPAMVALTTMTGAVTEPSLSADGLTLYFDDYVDVFSSTRAQVGGAWSTPAIVPELVSDFRGPDFGVDDLRLVAFRESVPDLYEWSRPDRSSGWGTPRRLDELSSSSTEGFPSLRSDGLEILFSSDRGGNERIYRATRPSLDEPFGAPEVIDIDPLLDTQTEGDPELSADGTTLYFVAGSGSLALYVSVRQRL